MTDLKDEVGAALKRSGAPFYVRWFWKLKGDEIMFDWLLSWLDKLFGKNWKRVAFGVVFCLVLVLHGIGQALGITSLDTLAHTIETVANQIGLGTGAPATIASGLAAIVALVALVQPVIRWALGKDAAPPSTQ